MKFATGLLVLTTLTAAGLAAPPDGPEIVKNGMGAVQFLRYSPSGKELVRICQFGGVEMFDVAGFDKMRTFAVGMRMVAFSADGKWIATAEGTDGARVWDAALPGKPLTIPKGAALAAVSVLDVPLKVLEAPSGGRGPSRDVKGRVFCAEFSPDGKRVVTTQADGHVKVWDTATWTVEDDLALTKSEVRAVAFAPSGQTLVIADVAGVLHEWSFATKTEVHTASARGAVMSVVFAPDGLSLLTVHQSSMTAYATVVWDGERKALETRDGVASVAFSKDGKTLALGGKRVELVDAATRKPVRTIELPELTMHETNAQLAKAAGADADAKMPVLVTALAWAPDGATLAAGCQDGSVRLVKTTEGR